MPGGARFGDPTEDGVILCGASTVLAQHLPAARKGDPVISALLGLGMIDQASLKVLIEGVGAAREEDLCVVPSPSKAGAGMPAVMSAGMLEALMQALLMIENGQKFVDITSKANGQMGPDAAKGVGGTGKYESVELSDYDGDGRVDQIDIRTAAREENAGIPLFTDSGMGGAVFSNSRRLPGDVSITFGETDFLVSAGGAVHTIDYGAILAAGPRNYAQVDAGISFGGLNAIFGSATRGPFGGGTGAAGADAHLIKGRLGGLVSVPVTQLVSGPVPFLGTLLDRALRTGGRGLQELGGSIVNAARHPALSGVARFGAATAGAGEAIAGAADYNANLRLEGDFGVGRVAGSAGATARTNPATGAKEAGLSGEFAAAVGAKLDFLLSLSKGAPEAAVPIPGGGTVKVRTGVKTIIIGG
jgi:uncharacterized Zn-binding protein involved in type VI secretion